LPGSALAQATGKTNCWRTDEVLRRVDDLAIKLRRAARVATVEAHDDRADLMTSAANLLTLQNGLLLVWAPRCPAEEPQ
jgi:hypothetical protein